MFSSSNQVTRRHKVERKRQYWRYNVSHENAFNEQTTGTNPLWPSLVYPSKIKLALAITAVVIISQIVIFHYYVGVDHSILLKSQRSLASLDIKLAQDEQWLCSSLPHLVHIINTAKQYNVDLALIDPDFINLISLSINPDGALKSDDVSFSKRPNGSGTSRLLQQTDKNKSVIHIAAINGTSGGQPSLRLFFNALKHSHYVINKYEDVSETMQPEVYLRPIHLFDDDDGQAGSDRAKSSHLFVPGQGVGEEEKVVSKIYTEFITHLLIVNRTVATETIRPCLDPRGGKASPFVVIHILVLYDHEYDPDNYWIQSSLHLDELEKHKLLSYGLHSFDFKIPLQEYYIHKKRPLTSIESQLAVKSNIMRSLKGLKLFSRGDRFLRFTDNKYSHCKQCKFNITGLMDNSKRPSKYLMLLDTANPLQKSLFKDEIMNQLAIAFKFMQVFSSTYGKFNYWITGSTLLSYYKFCELVIAPSAQFLDRAPASFSRSSRAKRTNQEYGDDLLEDTDESTSQTLEKDQIINLELGVFANELNMTMLEDLSKAHLIGVTMISDWRKPNGHISFHVNDCPNLIFNLYPYELRRDFYQYYYVTRNSMILNHKFRKKRSSPLSSLDNSSSTIKGEHHHVFTTDNLELCWTRIDRFHQFKIPCNIYEHLRRIYLI